MKCCNTFISTSVVGVSPIRMWNGFPRHSASFPSLPSAWRGNGLWQLLCRLRAWEDEICLLGFPPLIRSTGVSVCWNLCKKIDCVCCGGIGAAADRRSWGAALTLGWGSRNLLERNCPVSNSQLKSRLAVAGCHSCWIVNDDCRMC